MSTRRLCRCCCPLRSEQRRDIECFDTQMIKNILRVKLAISLCLPSSTSRVWSAKCVLCVEEYAYRVYKSMEYNKYCMFKSME